MYGAILGDIVGSPYEFDCNNYKAKDFPLFQMCIRDRNRRHGRSERKQHSDSGCRNHKYYDKIHPAGGRLFRQSLCRLYPWLQILLQMCIRDSSNCVSKNKTILTWLFGLVKLI